MSNMNPGQWTDAEIARLDFAWCKFFAPILSFEVRCEDIRKAGRQPTFLLIDHQNGRLTER